MTVETHCCGWDSSLTLRMTAVFQCHPEGISPKDPMAFSNNQQSLHCMGFFADAQNDKIKHSE